MENVALNHPGVRRVCLIAKAGLLGMYASCGFSLKGLSPVVHGKDPWFEMRTDLDSTEPRLLRFVQVRTRLVVLLEFLVLFSFVFLSLVAAGVGADAALLCEPAERCGAADDLLRRVPKVHRTLVQPGGTLTAHNHLIVCPVSWQIDSFSEQKFCGNPAAVFFTHAGGDADWMQKVKKKVFAVFIETRRGPGIAVASSRQSETSSTPVQGQYNIIIAAAALGIFSIPMK